MSQDLPNQIIMAFDFGMSRIGVAFGNSLLKIPHPLGIISGKNKFEKFEKIGALVAKWQPNLFVVGVPCSEDSAAIPGHMLIAAPAIQDNGGLRSSSPEKQQLITNIKKFANRLQANFNLQVNFVNEEYSSALAATKLKEQNVFALKQKDKLDALAAMEILQRYFDENI